MLIQLKWLSNNGNKSHSTLIYRSTAPFGNINEAELLATVEPGIDTYLDTDVIQGRAYYYMFVLKKGSRTSNPSKLFRFDATPYTGPGASTLTFGDEKFGYYQPFPAIPAAVPTLNYIRGLLGLHPAAEAYNGYPHKFAIGGTVRGIYSYPIAAGSEISLDDPNIQLLLSGEPIRFTLGLHEWAIVLPTPDSLQAKASTVPRFPGELRSMLGVVSELYARVEDAETGNVTGTRLAANNGRINFYQPLVQRYPGQTFNWMVTSEWDDLTCTAVYWTPEVTAYPNRPKELHIEPVDYSIPTNWEKTLIWPILVYTGLTGPINRSV